MTRKTYPRIANLVDAALILVKELETYTQYVKDEAAYAHRDEVGANARNYIAQGWDEESAYDQAREDVELLAGSETDEYEAEIVKTYQALKMIKEWLP